MLILCLALGACDQDEPSKKSDVKTKMDADALLLKDIARAGPEFERRLMANIHVQDGLLIVHDPVLHGLATYVLPLNSSWVISCGIGLSVVLGNSVSGDGTSVGNEIQINLTLGMIDQKDCDVLGPRLGKTLKTILNEGGQAARAPPP